ncbi:transferase domain protein [Mycobacterium kansasii]|uniref:Transferase domain protein n=1 Tax=Mycobacterium kansasii TaxID=1768 RepID=A0A1V3XDX3_MYCKA|nr:transferase domain protein [Mycobacterium kansasii]
MLTIAEAATAAAIPPTIAGNLGSEPVTSLRDSTVIAVVCPPTTDAGTSARR